MSRLDELDIVIRRKNDLVIAFIPEARLYAASPTLTGALQLLEKKKDELKTELDAMGMREEFVTAAPLGTTTRSAAVGNLLQFTLKGLMAVVMVVLALEYMASSIETRMDLFVEKVRNPLQSFKGGHGFWTRLEVELARQANQTADIPEARKQKILTDIRTLVQRWRPFVAEVSNLFGAADHAPQERNIIPSSPGHKQMQPGNVP